jgi:hypothetical protein
MGSMITGGLLAALMMVTLSGHSAAQAPPQESPQKKPELQRKIRRPNLTAVDHYRCYDVDQHGQQKPQKAELRDQFQSGGREVGRIVSICAPVTKRHNDKITKARYPQIHLVCYAVRPHKKIGKTVETSNQFGRARMTVAEEQTLCVPSLKRHARELEKQ